MHKRMSWLALLGGLIMVAALFGAAGGAQAAPRPAQAAPNASVGSCNDLFQLETTDNDAAGFIGSDNQLHFTGTIGLVFCQERLSINNSDVVIYTSANGDCLALNATTKQWYSHNPTGCGTASYTQWVFHPLGMNDPDNGLPVYSLQNLYAPSGSPCVYDDDLGAPATYDSCSVEHTDTFEWLDYVQR